MKIVEGTAVQLIYFMEPVHYLLGKRLHSLWFGVEAQLRWSLMQLARTDQNLILLQPTYQMMRGICAFAMFPFPSPVVCANAGTDGDHSRAGSFFLALRKDLYEHRGLQSGWGGQCF